MINYIKKEPGHLYLDIKIYSTLSYLLNMVTLNMPSTSSWSRKLSLSVMKNIPIRMLNIGSRFRRSNFFLSVRDKDSLKSEMSYEKETNGEIISVIIGKIKWPFQPSIIHDVDKGKWDFAAIR